MNLLKFYAPDQWIRNLGMPLIAILTLGFLPNLFYAAIIMLQLAFLQAFSFAINNYYDAKIRKEKNYLGILLKTQSSYKILFLCILPLILIALTSFISHGNIVFLLLYLFIYDFLYEVPPFRLKKSSFFSILASPLCLVALMYLYAYLAFTNTFSIKSIAFLVIFFFYMVFHELIHQMAHSKKEKILPKSLGINGGIKVVQAIISMLMIFSTVIILLNPASNYIFIITIAFSTFRIYKLFRVKPIPTSFEKIKYSWHKFYSVQEGIIYAVLLSLDYVL